MKLGASTACFYPLETEKALLKVTELGYKYAEVFMKDRKSVGRERVF